MFPISYPYSQSHDSRRATLQATLFKSSHTDPNFSVQLRPFLKDYLEGKEERFSRILERALKNHQIRPDVAMRPLFMNSFLLALKAKEFRSEQDLYDMKKKFILDFKNEKSFFSPDEVRKFYFSLLPYRSNPILREISLFLARQVDCNWDNPFEEMIQALKTSSSLSKEERLQEFKRFFSYVEKCHPSKMEGFQIKEFFFRLGAIELFEKEQEEDVFYQVADFLVESGFSEDELVDFFCKFCEEASIEDGSFFLTHPSFRSLSSYNERRVSFYINSN